MRELDPVTADLMAAGAPFELATAEINGFPMRVFKNAPVNLVDVLHAAGEFGDTEFIIEGERRLSFKDFLALSRNLAAWMVAEAGIKAGQSVAIAMKNSTDWMIAFAAIAHVGAVSVLVNSRGEPRSLRAAIEDADCVMAFVDARCFEKLRESGCDVKTVLSSNQSDGETIQKLCDYSKSVQFVERDTDDPASMFFTSGTTGRAKAAVISHRSLVTGMMNTKLAMTEAFTKIAKTYNMSVDDLRAAAPQACSLLIFPLFHTSGCSSIFLSALASGGKLVLMDRWNADRAIELIGKERISALGGVPAMHWDVLNSPLCADADFSSLTSLSCGGQAFPQNLIEAIRKRFPNLVLGMGYGMTETCGAISQANGEVFLQSPKSSGQVLPIVDVQIVNDQGEVQGPGGVGDIWVKGATLMQSYYKRPEETEASFKQGWFVTGDIGYIDEAGFVFIVDRKTDMVISSGENIYCAEVEQILSQHPAVLQISTFGIPDDRLGERLVACIHVGEGGLSKNDFMEFAKAELADYKVPTDVWISTQDFERNAMGKIEKHKLREIFLGDLS